MSLFTRAAIATLVTENEKRLKSNIQSTVWNLNLDQIEPDTGRVLSRQMVLPEKLGSSTYFFEEGTVLYSKLRPYLNKVVVADAPGVATTELVPLRCNPSKLLPQYLAYYLRSPEFLSFANTVVAGAKMPRMVMGEFWKYKIPVPPIEEQRKIVAILDQVDALRAKRGEMLAQIDKIEESVFDEFWQEQRDNAIECCLGELAEKSKGAFVNGPFGSDLLTSELQEEGVPVVYIRDIRNGEYFRVSKVCVSDTKARTLSVCTVHPGDVLVAKVGDPPGIAAIYPLNEPVAIVTQDVIRLRVDRTMALPEFILSYLNSNVGRRKISEITVEATRARFSLGDFKKMRIELPSLASQRIFVRKIEEIKRIKSYCKLASAELNRLFASVQHRAFRGEL